jgi:hypothetical protein
MRGVGVPGGPRSHGHTHKNKAKADQYRHSEAGMMARHLRNMNPEVKAHRKALRDAHRKLKGGF